MRKWSAAYISNPQKSMDESEECILSLETIQPHGGTLIDRECIPEEKSKWLSQIDQYPKLVVSSVTVSDLLLIATGGFSPLKGFMNQDDYKQVCRHMRLSNGVVWSIPIVLPVPKKKVKEIEASSHLFLYGPDQQLLAVMKPESIYSVDQRQEAIDVYQTDNERHPGVARLFQQSNLYVGGPIWLIQRPNLGIFSRYALDPKVTRRLFQQKNWRKVVGFQTRNPIHRAHEYMQKVALEMVDGLLLHPLVGETKADDVPAEIRFKSYQVLLDKFYPLDRVCLSVFPAAMRYAGPKEAVFHAIVRKNYGCTHFIVGRDHAGFGDFYGTYDAQNIFKQFTAQELGIELMFFEHCFYCMKCQGMASNKTCPHQEKDHLILSGTKVREMLRAGRFPPSEFSRAEVIQVLMDGMREKERM